MGISLASSSRGQLPPPHTLSSTSRGAHALICYRGHRPLEISSLPHALSHLPAVVLMRSSAVVGIVLSRSAPSQTLSSTSCGAHALICCRGHRPLEVCSLTDSLIYQLWCSCADLLSWASASRGLSPPPHTFSSTSCGAHALICCRGHRPLEVCSLPHTLSSTSSGALPSGGESSVSLSLPRARE